MILLKRIVSWYIIMVQCIQYIKYFQPGSLCHITSVCINKDVLQHYLWPWYVLGFSICQLQSSQSLIRKVSLRVLCIKRKWWNGACKAASWHGGATTLQCSHTLSCLLLKVFPFAKTNHASAKLEHTLLALGHSVPRFISYYTDVITTLTLGPCENSLIVWLNLLVDQREC